MLEVLGRATSGNVQKVLFLLEELGTPYKRHDYGKTFEGTTAHAAIPGHQPHAESADPARRRAACGESHTILRYVANKQEAHALYPRDPAARSRVERWMDWTLASLNVAYLAGFKEAKLPPEQLSEAAASCCPPSCRCWTGTWRAGPGSRARPSPGRHLPGASGAPLPEDSPSQARVGASAAMDGAHRAAAGFRGGRGRGLRRAMDMQANASAGPGPARARPWRRRCGPAA